MAGLLDMVNDPRQAFITQLGMGLLSAGGPSTKPVSFGQAFGAAMAPALQGAQQAQEYQLAQEEARRKHMAESQRQQTISQFIASLPPEQQAIARANPEKAIEAFYKAQEDYTLPPGSVRYRGGQPLVSAPFKPAEPSEFERTLIAAGMQPGSPGYMSAMSDYVRKQTTHAPATNVNVSTKQESEEAKSIGSALGKEYSSLQSSSMASQGTIAKLNRLESIIKGLDTGKLTPIGMSVASVAESLGIKIDPNLGQKQAAEAIANELALRAKQQGETNLMPGAMSEADRNFLVAMAPSMSKTPEANRLLIETARRMEKRNVEIARLAREYRAKNKTFEGFAEFAQDYAERNPLFKDMQAAPVKNTGARFLGFE